MAVVDEDGHVFAEQELDSGHLAFHEIGVKVVVDVVGLGIVDYAGVKLVKFLDVGVAKVWLKQFWIKQ